MIIAALLFLLNTATTATTPPAPTADAPLAASAGEGPRTESALPLTSTRTRAEVRAEAIEAARAARETSR